MEVIRRGSWVVVVGIVVVVVVFSLGWGCRLRQFFREFYGRGRCPRRH